MIFLGSLMKILQQAEKYRVGVSLNKERFWGLGCLLDLVRWQVAGAQ